jgi:hypothetical protein
MLLASTMQLRKFVLSHIAIGVTWSAGSRLAAGLCVSRLASSLTQPNQTGIYLNRNVWERVSVLLTLLRKASCTMCLLRTQGEPSNN